MLRPWPTAVPPPDMAKPRILIAYPSSFYVPRTLPRFPLKTSLVLLASFLARFFTVEYADFEISVGRPDSPAKIRRFRRRVKDFLEKAEFDILALSCWTSLSYQATMAVAEIARDIHPDKLIVVGGYHTSARPHDFMTENNLFDYVICGEGELTLKKIAEESLASGRPKKTIVVRAPVFPDDDFTGYNWDLFDRFLDEYVPEGIGSSAYMFLSRGCPFGCAFCMEPLKDRRWRAFSPEKAVDEMLAAVKKYKAKAVAISDACFGMRPGWRKEFLQRLVDLEPEFWIVIETRPEYVDDNTIELLSILKKVEVQMGVESCSPEILRLMKKSGTPEKFLTRFREVSHKLSDRGIMHLANLIFNHPGETRRTLEETFSFIDKELARKDTCLMWATYGFMHFPGCELDLNREFYEQKFGTRFLKDEWWKEEEDQWLNSLKVIPSRDLDGDGAGLWIKMFAERRDAKLATLSPEARAFAIKNRYQEPV